MSKEDQLMMGFMDLLNKKVLLDKFRMKESLEGYKPSEVHCIEYIGKNTDSNVTKIAESSYMTRGAISKLTRKLIKKSIIECYQRSDNRKEVYFRLTEQGETIYKVHEKLHEEFRIRDKAVFEQVTEEQLDIMINFAERYNMHLNAEIKKQGVDLSNYNHFD